MENLEADAKKTLMVWPYHCIQGTTGCSLENQFANMVYFHSVAKKAATERMVKGYNPLSEMYGIIREEAGCTPENNTNINIEFLNKLEKYDKIIIAGEAKSH